MGLAAPVAQNYRKWNQDISGSQSFTAAATTTTLQTARSASHTIYVQRIIVTITTDAAQSWTFQDSNGTPLVIAVVATSPGVGTRWEFNFGDRGLPLTQGKDLTNTMSAAGLAGNVEWEGYMRLTAAVAPGTTN